METIYCGVALCPLTCVRMLLAAARVRLSSAEGRKKVTEISDITVVKIRGMSIYKGITWSEVVVQ